MTGAGGRPVTGKKTCLARYKAILLYGTLERTEKREANPALAKPETVEAIDAFTAVSTVILP